MRLNESTWISITFNLKFKIFQNNRQARRLLYLSVQHDFSPNICFLLFDFFYFLKQWMKISHISKLKILHYYSFNEKLLIQFFIQFNSYLYFYMSLKRIWNHYKTSLINVDSIYNIWLLNNILLKWYYLILIVDSITI